MSLKIKEIISALENWAPKSYQESYDNSGLIIGDKNQDCSGVLVSLDCTEEIIEEAVATGCNMVVSHHPILFGGIKTLTGKNYVERSLLKAIKNDVAIYAIHTNLDNVKHGVNHKISEKLGLKNCQILAPKERNLSKMAFYGIPEDCEKIKEAVFLVGGGAIGEYSECSFATQGYGSFKPSELSNPAIGEKGQRKNLEENKVEIVVPNYLVASCLEVARKASSYEELAYDVISLTNTNQEVGSGMIGELEEALSTEEFLQKIKKTFNTGGIRYAGNTSKQIKKVALCGGSGFFLLPNAIAAKADAFMTADIKYHQFFEAEKHLLLADIGHYESEFFTQELIASFLIGKFPTFAVRLTSKNSNPVNYF